MRKKLAKILHHVSLTFPYLPSIRHDVNVSLPLNYKSLLLLIYIQCAIILLTICARERKRQIHAGKILM